MIYAFYEHMCINKYQTRDLENTFDKRALVSVYSSAVAIMSYM